MNRNTKSRIILFILLFFCVVLHTTLAARIAVLGGVLHLPLLFVALAGVFRGRESGLLWGILAGLLLDLLAGKYIGLNMLAMMAAGWACGAVFARAYKGNILLSFAAVAVAVAAYAAVYLLAARFAGIGLVMTDYLLHYALPTFIYTAVLALPVYVLANRSYQKHDSEFRQARFGL